jgi:hypothetical protein
MPAASRCSTGSDSASPRRPPCAALPSSTPAVDRCAQRRPATRTSSRSGTGCGE